MIQILAWYFIKKRCGTDNYTLCCGKDYRYLLLCLHICCTWHRSYIELVETCRNPESSSALSKPLVADVRTMKTLNHVCTLCSPDVRVCPCLCVFTCSLSVSMCQWEAALWSGPPASPAGISARRPVPVKVDTWIAMCSRRNKTLLTGCRELICCS